MTNISTNLVVTGQPVQSIFSQYINGNISVNRRYQRKLVWSIQEKEGFIDSLRRDLPVPLILTAAIEDSEGARIEIIDGLQRLNAVVSFIEGDFAIDGMYFDPETLAETKLLLDEGKLPKRGKILPRNECIRLAAYNLPVSTYRAHDQSDVEEIFRRINSGGRHLSRQELRQAGSTGAFASIVRRVSSSIRGDYSVEDMIDLRQMPKISLTSSPDHPGVLFDDLPWIRHGILDREQVRTSRDEEVVTDLLISIISGQISSYESRTFDSAYTPDSENDSLYSKLEVAIAREKPEVIESRISHVMDIFQKIFDPSIRPFSKQFFEIKQQRVPRYFESVFLAIDDLIFNQKTEFIDFLGAAEALKGFGSKHMDIPGGGGSWTAASKRKNIGVVKGILSQYTKPSSGFNDPLLERTATEIRNLLTASNVEAPLFELKQGFCSLGSKVQKNEKIVEDIARTLCAMANSRPGARGYLIVGVSDTESDARRVSKITGSPLAKASSRFITGLEIDVNLHGSIDDVLLWFTSKFRSFEMNTELQSQILENMRIAKLEERDVLLITVTGIMRPVTFREKYFTRQGSQTVELPASQFDVLFRRFSNAI